MFGCWFWELLLLAWMKFICHAGPRSDRCWFFLPESTLLYWTLMNLATFWRCLITLLHSGQGNWSISITKDNKHSTVRVFWENAWRPSYRDLGDLFNCSTWSEPRLDLEWAPQLVTDLRQGCCFRLEKSLGTSAPPPDWHVLALGSSLCPRQWSFSLWPSKYKKTPGPIRCTCFQIQ